MLRIHAVMLAGLLGLAGCPGWNDAPVDDDDTTQPTYDEPQVADVSLSVHETIGSIVVARWEQRAPATVYVEYGFDEGVWHASPAQAVEAGAQEVLLLGIPYDIQVTARVINDFGEGPLADGDHGIRTAEAPQMAPQATLVDADPAAFDPQTPYVMGSIDERLGGGLADYWVFIVDRKGRLVWALMTPHFRMTIHGQPSYDGKTILIDHNTFWAIFDGGAASQVQRVTIDGAEVELYDTPGLHHPFTELDDGSLVWGTILGYDEEIWKLSPDGEITTLWACSDFHGMVEGVPSSAYCASNTLWWNEADDTFLMSFYSTETVVEIDHATGTVLRYFGHLPDAWAFDPDDSAFWWQHGCHYTDEGTLLVSSRNLPHGDETLVREYALDRETETLTQIWSFGEGEGVYGSEMGQADRLPGGNTLHNYGSAARLREATPEGVVVWDLLWEDSVFLGRTTALDDLYAFLP